MGKRKAASNCETKTVLKPSLTVPFDNGMSWPLVEKAKNKCIIEEMKKELPMVIKKRPSSKDKLSKSQKRKRDTSSIGHKLVQNDLMLIGINAVTKALERGPLLLVLVCTSARPVSMTHHLISLCAIRDTPGCCINGLSTALSEILAINSVLAVGFKERQDNPLQDLVQFITDKTPPLIVPWVNIWKNDPLLKEECTKKEVDNGEKRADKNGDKEVDSYGEVSENKLPGADNTFVEGTVTLAITENKLTSECPDTPKCNYDLHEPKKGIKRKLVDVNYSLYDTNFKFKEVNIQVKKKNKAS